MHLPAPRTIAPLIGLALLVTACGDSITEVQVAAPPEAAATSSSAAPAAPATATDPSAPPTDVATVAAVTTGTQGAPPAVPVGQDDGDSSQVEPTAVPTPPEDLTVVVQVDGVTVVPASPLCRREDGTVGLAIGVDTEVVVDDSGEAVMALVGPDGTTVALRTETFAKLGAVTWIGTFDPAVLDVGEVVVSTGDAPPAC